MACGKRLFAMGNWPRRRLPPRRCKPCGLQGQTRRGMDRVAVNFAARAALEAARRNPALVAA
jgi:TPP-dependent pyruvate/acetoin dehydrogenase alpha subunit